MKNINENKQSVDSVSSLLLNATDAAKTLAISPRKLWGMTSSGEIPHVKLGRCVRYPVDGLQRWINDQLE